MEIEAVILYSTNDYRFFNTCISNLVNCNIKCHVITYSHMWNGEVENKILLEKSQDNFKDIDLVDFYQIDWISGSTSWYWEGLGRYLGTQQVSQNCQYILYIDIDEIIDPIKFKNWIDKQEYKQYDALKLACYWYWREPEYQAEDLEDSVILFKTELAKTLPMQSGGRELYFNSGRKVIRFAESHDPMIHHYSWVRTKEQMLKKTNNWGHNNDRGDWVDLIEEEFSRPFNGTDFLHNYTYKTIENIFNI